MKVLLSAFAFAPNKGSEPGVGWNWALALSNKNDVWVITREENRREIEIYKKSNKLPFNVLYFGISFFEKHPRIPYQKNIYYMMWQKKVLKFAMMLHKDIAFDLCHHITYASFKYPTELYKIGIPLVVGPVGGGERTPRSCVSVYKVTDWFIDKIHDAQIKWVIHKPGFHSMCKKAKVILVTTQQTSDCFPPKYSGKVSIMQTIGISENEILPLNTCKKCSKSEKFIVLYVGNLIALKGIFLLPQIAKKLNDSNVVYRIIGDGPLKNKMIREVERYGLSDHFDFIDSVSREKVLDYMDKAHVFIFPSFHDSGAMVVLEAMGRRLPVIVLGTGGPDIHVNIENGMKVNPNQPLDCIVQDFSDKIGLLKKQYLENEDAIDHMINSATDYLYSECTWERKADRMQLIYNAAVGSN